MSLEPWQVASAFSHPVRARITQAFVAAGEPISPNTLARQLGESLGRVSYHVRTLNDSGVIVLASTRPRRGAVEHFYELADDERLRAAARVLGPA